MLGWWQDVDVDVGLDGLCQLFMSRWREDVVGQERVAWEGSYRQGVGTMSSPASGTAFPALALASAGNAERECRANTELCIHVWQALDSRSTL